LNIIFIKTYKRAAEGKKHTYISSLFLNQKTSTKRMISLPLIFLDAAPTFHVSKRMIDRSSIHPEERGLAWLMIAR
jgi:hypothetical protein